MDENGPLHWQKIGACYVYPTMGHYMYNRSSTDLNFGVRREHWHQHHVQAGTRLPSSFSDMKRHEKRPRERYLQGWTPKGLPIVGPRVIGEHEPGYEELTWRSWPVHNKDIWKQVDAAVGWCQVEDPAQLRTRLHRRAEEMVGLMKRRIRTKYCNEHNHWSYDFVESAAPRIHLDHGEKCTAYLQFYGRYYNMPKCGNCWKLFTKSMARGRRFATHAEDIEYGMKETDNIQAQTNRLPAQKRARR